MPLWVTISQSDAYQRFNSEDMDKFAVKFKNLPSKDIFKPSFITKIRFMKYINWNLTILTKSFPQPCTNLHHIIYLPSQSDKLGKHMAHLIRLYMMGLDILEREEIVTYRENEHDLLMGIRNGDYLDSNSQPVSAFYDILNEYEKRFDYAKNTIFE